MDAVGRDQHVAVALQLGEIFDAFADASLERLLHRHADAGDPDRGTAPMQLAGDRGIDLGAECDQGRRLGCRQFENSNKLRRGLEQARAMLRLMSKFRVSNFRADRPDIAEFPEQTMNIVNHARPGRFTEQ
ncbi:hypothetical protein [Bradyrhizobium sp.]|uniref:hypothetical protein n=1 Tax=Bradyrhizobium sp. TaxID=376 RepID=UPI0025C5A283|nr:hypothetical protein [Bradyrhizobium sp.]